MEHEYGGDWTEDKLDKLRKYLPAYTRIFNSNPRARYLTTIYVDAFAGSGYRRSRSRGDAPLFGEVADPDAIALLKGSARIALEVEPPFDRYIFVDVKSAHAKALQALCDEFAHRRDRVEVLREDANAFLRKWIGETDWRKTRAVVFLDPYGMQVKWDVIAALGRTKSVDLWILFSLEGANRHLTRNRIPTGGFASRLDALFGTAEWRTEFYVSSPQPNLFDDSEGVLKDADFDKIAGFFRRRLRDVFYRVADNDLILRNSRNVPLFLFCFASANPKGASTAINIANYILKP